MILCKQKELNFLEPTFFLTNNGKVSAWLDKDNHVMVKIPHAEDTNFVELYDLTELLRNCGNRRI